MGREPCLIDDDPPGPLAGRTALRYMSSGWSEFQMLRRISQDPSD